MSSTPTSGTAGGAASADVAAPGAPALTSLPLRPLAALPPPPAEDDPLGFPGYPGKLAAARSDGQAESLEVGTVRLGDLAATVADPDRELVVARGVFAFLGGSMGRVHGDRIAAAFAVARERRVPLVAVTASGGARMQEGMLALVQMARAAEGARQLREAGVPLLTYATDPTTGGVHASYGSLGDAALAEAGATVGFAGPRVVEAFTGHRVGPDSHTAEAALAAGLVDEVVGPHTGAVRLARFADLLHPQGRHGPLPETGDVEEPTVEHDAWDAVRRARRPDRPGARELLATVLEEHVELRGDRAGEDDPAAVAAVARLGRRSVVVVGFDGHGTADAAGRRPGQATAAGYRKLRRALELARRHALPVVALVDTPGADPSPASDTAGLASAIAETFVAVLAVESPTVAVVCGEGGSGGALAIAATDRVLMQDDAVFEVIAPEGAASILHRDPTRAEEVAPLLRPTASELRRLGVVDRIVPGPTTFDPRTAATALRAQLAATLRALDGDRGRLAARRARYGPATGR